MPNPTIITSSAILPIGGNQLANRVFTSHTVVTASSYDYVTGSTPFGWYDNDTQFVSDGPKVAIYVARKLGYSVMDVELNELNIYACFEEAVSTYALEVYTSKLKDDYLSLQGMSTASQINNTVIVPNLNSIVAMADNYGSLIGIGGTTEWYTGSLDLIEDQQVYDMQEWAYASASLAQNDRIVIQRLFYESQPAINQYYDPYIGGSINYQGATENFGWASYSPGLNFVLFPIYWDIARIQEIEMSNYVRRSTYTFELINNKLRIFPKPEGMGRKLWFNYSKQSEINNPASSSIYGTNQGLVTNPSNAPYGNITYSQINAIGRQWIYEYTLALAAETLGLIRGKYTQVPVPGAEVSLNGADLISKGQTAQRELRERLRGDLDEMSRKAQLEKQAQENQNIQDTLNNVPLFIYIG
jgi:hypothetical protein